MARFVRTHPAPQVTGAYTKFRAHVQQDFRRCCAYCLLPELEAAGESNFEMDHFRPRSKFTHLLYDFHNLYWSCSVCNGNKWNRWPTPQQEQMGLGFVDFCKDDFQDHFQLSPDGFWIPTTVSGQYTEAIIKLNSPHLVAKRLQIRWRP
jgi:uncharacterized protein (TIGR02646 family)